MLRKLLLLLFLFSFLFTTAQTDKDSAWVIENYVKKEIYIPMRDGVKLFTSVYVPKDTNEKHPILMIRTPYSCAPYGATFSRQIYLRLFPYARENYIIIQQDVRGKFMSEGEFVDVRPFIKDKKTNKDIDEASDAYDAIDWLVKNLPDNNGNVGIFGVSYPGFYATMAAASGHPALKAVSPQAPVTEWFLGDDIHHNGAFFQMINFGFFSSLGIPIILDSYKFYLKTGTLKNLLNLGRDSLKFWEEVYAHPNYDDWWKARDARRAMYNIKPAMLIIGGLFDAEDCYGSWNLYKAIEKQSPNANNKLVMGPWSHGQWGGRFGTSLGNIQFGSNTSLWYQNNIEIPFFNYYLKGKGDNSNLAEATIFFTGANEWKKINKWPPEEMNAKPIYLESNQSLSWNKPVSKNSFSEYISDPAHPVPYIKDVHFNRQATYMNDDQSFASTRTDVLTFQTDVLAEDMTLAGPVTADLSVSITGTDADFLVKVIDVFPDDFIYPGTQSPVNGGYPMGGYQMLVRGEIMRGKFRNSFEKPIPFTPNKVEKVKFELPDIAHTFKKGHRLMIQIQSSWFPLVDRNPQKFVNIYEADEKDFQKATIKIYHDTINSSSIILPIIK